MSEMIRNSHDFKFYARLKLTRRAELGTGDRLGAETAAAGVLGEYRLDDRDPRMLTPEGPGAFLESEIDRLSDLVLAAAWEKIFVKYHPLMVACAYRALPPSLQRHAEDVAGNVWEYHFRRLKRGDYVPRDNLRTELCNLCRNRAISVMRRERVKTEADMSSDDAQASAVKDAADSFAGGADEAIDGEKMERLHAAIAALPEAEREAFRLHYFEALTYEEIADRIGMSTTTAYNRVQSAQGRLREGLLKTKPDPA